MGLARPAAARPLLTFAGGLTGIAVTRSVLKYREMASSIRGASGGGSAAPQPVRTVEVTRLVSSVDLPLESTLSLLERLRAGGEEFMLSQLVCRVHTKSVEWWATLKREAREVAGAEGGTPLSTTQSGSQLRGLQLLIGASRIRCLSVVEAMVPVALGQTIDLNAFRAAILVYPCAGESPFIPVGRFGGGTPDASRYIVPGSRRLPPPEARTRLGVTEDVWDAAAGGGALSLPVRGHLNLHGDNPNKYTVAKTIELLGSELDESAGLAVTMRVREVIAAGSSSSSSAENLHFTEQYTIVQPVGVAIVHGIQLLSSHVSLLMHDKASGRNFEVRFLHGPKPPVSGQGEVKVQARVHCADRGADSLVLEGFAPRVLRVCVGAPDVVVSEGTPWAEGQAALAASTAAMPPGCVRVDADAAWESGPTSMHAEDVPDHSVSYDAATNSTTCAICVGGFKLDGGDGIHHEIDVPGPPAVFLGGHYGAGLAASDAATAVAALARLQARLALLQLPQSCLAQRGRDIVPAPPAGEGDAPGAPLSVDPPSKVDRVCPPLRRGSRCPFLARLSCRRRSQLETTQTGGALAVRALSER